MGPTVSGPDLDLHNNITVTARRVVGAFRDIITIGCMAAGLTSLKVATQSPPSPNIFFFSQTIDTRRTFTFSRDAREGAFARNNLRYRNDCPAAAVAAAGWWIN